MARGMSPAEIDLDDRLYGAWVCIDLHASPPDGRGLGVKDLIDVRSLPTGCGFSPWRDRLAGTDAEVVRRLRDAGWVPVGKTQTTQFAYLDPAPTVSPFDPAQTPGGSSTGSAVAVALGHVPLALGTQTGGSIVRPAGYCGVVGAKPTFGLIPTSGVQPLAPSMDTVGFLADSVATAAGAMGAVGVAVEGAGDIAGDDTLVVAPRFDHLLADEGTRSGYESVVEALQAAFGRRLQRDEAGVDIAAAGVAHRHVLAREAWDIHRDRYQAAPQHYAAGLSGLLERGRELATTDPGDDLEAFRGQCDRIRGAIPKGGVLLVPTAPGQPPPRRDTGSPVLANPWTMAGLPVVAVPWRLPAPPHWRGGIQVVGAKNADAQCLRAAGAIEQVLSAAGLRPELPHRPS